MGVGNALSHIREFRKKLHLKGGGYMKKSAKQVHTLVKDQSRAGLFFVMPTMIVFTVFVFIPLIISFVFSFLNFDMMFNNIKFIKFENYSRLLADKKFWNSLWNNVYYTLGTVPLQIIVALLSAVAIAKASFIHTLFKSVFFLPVICSMTIISIIWSFLINKDIGTFSYYLNFIGIKAVDLLKDPVWAMPTIILVSVWKSFGFNMVILVAGLQAIPDSYYEAADIDGINRFHKFLNITVPMLMPTLTFTVVNSIISSFQVFDQVYVMTRGGPLFKTQTVVQYIYSAAFESFNMSYASTVAVVLFFITFAISMYTFQSMSKDEDNLN
jgi:multiple sugar transport system permease protein